MSSKIPANSPLNSEISVFKAFIFSRALASLSLAVASKENEIRNYLTRSFTCITFNQKIFGL